MCIFVEYMCVCVCVCCFYCHSLALSREMRQNTRRTQAICFAAAAAAAATFVLPPYNVSYSKVNTPCRHVARIFTMTENIVRPRDY